MGRTVLRGARVVDGSGAPAHAATVVVADDRIESVGEAVADDEVVDLDGLVLAPGFIDLHTHYDAQVLWDPDLSPSSWHGITTVVMGNCGFGIAPARPPDRHLVLETLEIVEGMAAEALQQGIRWEFESFGEYLDVVERSGTRLNVGVFVGHTPLRFYVLGAEAQERPATPSEVTRMASLVRD